MDCSSGTIADAMSQAQPGDTIMITGTCNETVEVDKDGITLDGGGSAVIDGAGIDAAVISVNGHQNVTIKGLTVQNGLSGIRLVESAAAWLVDVTAQGSRSKSGYESGPGIVVATSSTVVLSGAIVAKDNAQNGIWVGQSSSAVVLGNYVIQGNRWPSASVQVSGNGAQGIQVLVNSSLNAYSASGEYTTIHVKDNAYDGVQVADSSSFIMWSGTNFEATGNGGSGLSVGNSSSAAFYGFGTEARGASGLFDSNGGAGISVWGSSNLNVWDDGVAVNITSTNNAWRGLNISDGSAASFNSPASEPPSRVVISGNGAEGIEAAHNATLASRIPLEARNNAYEGVGVWGSSHVDLTAATVADNNGFAGLAVITNSSAYLNGCRIENNVDDGIHAGNNSTVHLYDITITGNTGHGIAAYNHAFVQSYQDVGSSITGNGGHGVNAWNGVSIQLDNATITGNTNNDVNASFGSRLYLPGTNLGTVYCDDSVLSAGDAVCPE